MTEPSKTAELEAKLNQAMAMPGLTHAIPSPSFAAAEPITFPEPAADWGTVTHVFLPNPKWRWWAFWRPRALWYPMPPVTIHSEGAQGVRELKITYD